MNLPEARAHHRLLGVELVLLDQGRGARAQAVYLAGQVARALDDETPATCQDTRGRREVLGRQDLQRELVLAATDLWRKHPQGPALKLLVPMLTGYTSISGVRKAMTRHGIRWSDVRREARARALKLT